MLLSYMPHYATRDLKNSLIARVKGRDNKNERFIKVNEELSGIDLGIMLKDIANSKTQKNKVILSRCITNDQNCGKNWRTLDKGAIDSFNEWHMDEDNNNQFELIFPLHTSNGEKSGHFFAGRILFNKVNKKLNVVGEIYDSIAPELSENYKKLFENVINQIIQNKIDCNISYDNKIIERKQGKGTNSCGFYTAEFIEKLASGLPANKLEAESLDDSDSRVVFLGNLLGKDRIEIFNEDELKTIRRKIVTNFLSSNNEKAALIEDRSDIFFDESKVSEDLKAFYNNGKLAKGCEIYNNTLKYIPEEFLVPKNCDKDVMFLVNMQEIDGKLIIKGEYPFDKPLIFKIPEGENSLNIIMGIRNGGLKQYENFIEFEGSSKNSEADKLDFKKRIEYFDNKKGINKGKNNDAKII